MNRDKLFSCLTATVLAFLLSVGTTGCFASAFDLDMGMLSFLIPAAAALLFSSLLSLPWGGVASVCILVLGTGFLWLHTDLVLQVEALVSHISDFYNRGYGWGILRWSDKDLSNVGTGVPLLLLSLLITFITAWVVCHKASAFWAVLSISLPIATCIVLNDTVPSTGCLAITLFALIILIMTQTVRKHNAADGNRLVLLLSLPLALGLALLFGKLPRDGYTPPPEDLAQRIVTWFQEGQIGDKLAEQIVTAFSDSTGEVEDLKNTGPRGQQNFRVMTVTAAQDGPLYLRGRAFDTYDGECWTVSDGHAWSAFYNVFHQDGPLGIVTVTTNSVHDVLYTPYNPTDEMILQMEQGRLNNPEKLKTYSFLQLYSGVISSDHFSSQGSTSSIGLEPVSQFLALPENTRTAAKDYLSDHLGDYYPGVLREFSNTDQTYYDYFTYNVFECAQKIADLVRRSARYDLRTSRMPAGEPDFAMWFLEDSDTGYCVHFATAAAVLLRAADIPARYVTGYLADGSAGEEVAVRGKDAHAWVEYWLPGMGWVVLEATPAAPDAPPETTAPSEETTTAPEEPEPDPTEELPVTTAPDTSEPPSDPAIHDTTAPTPPGTPSLPGGADGPTHVDVKAVLLRLKPMFITLLVITLLSAFLWGQWKLRLILCQRWLCCDNPNTQALRRWREALFLSRVMKLPLPQELEPLALKARFSQYTLTQQELSEFSRFRAAVVETMRRRSLPMQLWYRLVLAIY